MGWNMGISLVFSAVMAVGVVFLARFLMALLRECELPKILRTFAFRRNKSSFVVVNGDSQNLRELAMRDREGCRVDFLRERLPRKRRAAIFILDIPSPLRDEPFAKSKHRSRR
jgi:hypothetical protein